jgi:hypothetical protein
MTTCHKILFFYAYQIVVIYSIPGARVQSVKCSRDIQRALASLRRVAVLGFASGFSSFACAG